jgi:hypothetical protein
MEEYVISIIITAQLVEQDELLDQGWITKPNIDHSLFQQTTVWAKNR